jgi:phage pi2 protein 07
MGLPSAESLLSVPRPSRVSEKVKWQELRKSLMDFLDEHFSLKFSSNRLGLESPSICSFGLHLVKIKVKEGGIVYYRIDN